MKKLIGLIADLLRARLYRRALEEIADWENYNLGGDPKMGWHPARIADHALGRDDD